MLMNNPELNNCTVCGKEIPLRRKVCSTLCRNRKGKLGQMRKYPDLMKQVMTRNHEKYPEMKNILKTFTSNSDLQSSKGIKGIRSHSRPRVGQYGKSQYYNNIFMRSSWEVKFAQMCDERGIKWEYEPRDFTLKSGERIIPDFFLPEKNVWVQIKPKHFQENLRRQMSLFPHNNVILSLSEFGEYLNV